MSTTTAGMIVDTGALLHPAGAGSANVEYERPLHGSLKLRLVTFAALALFGIERWATLLRPSPTGRLLGLLALSVLVVALGSRVASVGRWAVAILAAAAAIAVLALSGVPLDWIRHVRIAVTATGLSQGISALPRALVPYLGINQWLRIVIVGAAGLLLLDGALMVACAPRDQSDFRRAVSTIPMLALAVVPMTLVRPELVYVQGLLLFVLLAAFMWADRLHRDEVVVSGVVVALAAAGAMVAAPALRRPQPWLDYQALTNSLAPAHPDAFDWTQRYGPLNWPRDGRNVIEVQATRADYWKAEDLDTFDGYGWAAASVSASDPQYTVDPVNLRQWTQTLHVTLLAMTTHNVIAAGDAEPPTHLSGAVGGLSQGTWTAPVALASGDSYEVKVYDPQPTPTELADAGNDYPGVLLPGYLTIAVPALQPRSTIVPLANGVTPQPLEELIFPPFGSSTVVTTPGSVTPDPQYALRGTPYARVYALAQRLEHGATSPYAYVQNVEHYLGDGFKYDENPPASRYPLSTFLLGSHRGYCQQFAGAMALLLRMGGVPARVAAGFTNGIYDRATHSWLVSDIDAHAWVEAWFPRLGWVKFDPTPPAAPARGGQSSGGTVKTSGTEGAKRAQNKHGLGPQTDSGAHRLRHSAKSGSDVGMIAWITTAIVILLALAAACVRVGQPDAERRLAELERALARSGRALPPTTTLASLEQRFSGSEAARDYVRALRLSRFAPVGSVPVPAGRRAVRAELRSGLGVSGAVRALWALPPRITLPRPRWWSALSERRRPAAARSSQRVWRAR